MSALSLSEDFRASLKDRFRPDERTVLAKVEGDLTGGGHFVSVIKVKTRDSLLVEVYRIDPKTGEQQKAAGIELPERRDGHFQFRGGPTNLALVDLDGDGILEIAVPTYDDNLIPRLHVYRFDPQAEVFIRASRESLPGAESDADQRR